MVVSVLILAAGGTALGADLLSSSPGYTGCLSQSGDLLRFAAGDSPLKPCTGNQVQVHLDSSDLVSILAGTGLDVSAENGVATLSLDPSYQLPQGCEFFQVARWDGNSWFCSDADPGHSPLPQ